MDNGTKLACRVTEALADEKGSYAETARYLGVNPGLVWRAVRKNYAAPKLVYALARKGLVERPPPKEVRPRTWMRTDDVEKAVEKLMDYYSLEEVVGTLEGQYPELIAYIDEFF